MQRTTKSPHVRERIDLVHYRQRHAICSLEPEPEHSEHRLRNVNLWMQKVIDNFSKSNLLSPGCVKHFGGRAMRESKGTLWLIP